MILRGKGQGRWSRDLRSGGDSGPIVALGASWAGSAQADPLTAAQILQTYNLVTKGNALTTSDIEGSSAVGGSSAGRRFSTTHIPPARRPQSLYVFGTLANTNPLNVNDLGAPHPAPTLFYNGTASPRRSTSMAEAARRLFPPERRSRTIRRRSINWRPRSPPRRRTTRRIPAT